MLRQIFQHRNFALIAAFFCVIAGAFDWTGTEPGERIFRSRARTTRCGHSIGQRHVVLDSIHDDLRALMSSAASPDSGDRDGGGGPRAASLFARGFEIPAGTGTVIAPFVAHGAQSGHLALLRGRAPPPSSFL